MPSFQRLAELTLVLDRLGGEGAVSDCRARMSLTRLAMAQLLTDAVAAGVAEVRNDRCRLLGPGASLAGAMSERLAWTETRSLESFQPYTTYVPGRWWPENSRQSL